MYTRRAAKKRFPFLPSVIRAHGFETLGWDGMIAAAARIYRSIWSLHGRNIGKLAGYGSRGVVEGLEG